MNKDLCGKGKKSIFAVPKWWDEILSIEIKKTKVLWIYF